jgi:hypothetical protein
MAIGKWAKKKSAQATKAVGKRYGVSYGRRGVRFSKNSMSKIAKDVMMIKSQLNVEKKFRDTAETVSGSVGQVNVNADGFAAYQVTPQIAQGVQESQRVGNSIKATGLVLKLNMIKQINAQGPRRAKIFVIRTTDPGISGSDVHNRILDVNQMSGVRDYHSNLDYTQLKDGRLRILTTKYVYLPQDSGVASGTMDTRERQTKAITIALKLNEVLRYNANGDDLPENVRYWVVMVADNGNKGSTNSGLVDINVWQDESAVAFKMTSRFWYVDN